MPEPREEDRKTPVDSSRFVPGPLIWTKLSFLLDMMGALGKAQHTTQDSARSFVGLSEEVAMLCFLFQAAKGIPAQTYKTLRDLVRTQQQQKAKKFPHLLSLREKLIQDVTWKVKQQQKEDDTLLQQVSVISGKRQCSSPWILMLGTRVHSQPVIIVMGMVSTVCQAAPSSTEQDVVSSRN